MAKYNFQFMENTYPKSSDIYTGEWSKRYLKIGTFNDSVDRFPESTPVYTNKLGFTPGDWLMPSTSFTSRGQILIFVDTELYGESLYSLRGKNVGNSLFMNIGADSRVTSFQSAQYVEVNLGGSTNTSYVKTETGYNTTFREPAPYHLTSGIPLINNFPSYLIGKERSEHEIDVYSPLSFCLLINGTSDNIDSLFIVIKAPFVTGDRKKGFLVNNNILDVDYCVIRIPSGSGFEHMKTLINSTEYIPDYPYKPTPPHGGNGDQDFSSDDIPSPINPTWSAVACGLCRAYSPTLAEVQAMAGELWSSDFVDSMKKLYNDPMEAVISFGVIPVQPNTADTTTPLVVGNYTFTSASARPVTSNFVTVDCGEVTLPKQYDGFQDYEPYTKIQIYLPFIGNQTVTPSDVVGKTVHLYYRIDVLTGACLAWMLVDNRVLYQWIGNCFTEISLSKNSKAQIYSQIIHGIVNTITSSAQGGAAAGAAGAALGGVSGIISTITDVATSKHSDVMRTGALNPASSTLGVRTPYFIISYPTMVTPEGYASAKGIPVNAGGTIGEFSGYTVVDSVHLENIAATENELREIESLLTGGVIL